MQVYTDNLFLVDEDRLLSEAELEAAERQAESENPEEYTDPREPEVDDYIFTFSPGIELGYASSRIDSLLTVQYDFLKYEEFSELDDIDQLYKGTLDYQLTAYTRLDLLARYKRDSRPDRDLESSGLIYGTQVRKLQDYSIGLEHDLSEKSLLSFGYGYSQDDFSESKLDERLVELEEERAMEEEVVETDTGETIELEPTYAEELRASREANDSKTHTVSLSYQRDISDWIENSYTYSTAQYLHYETMPSTMNNLMLIIGGGHEFSEIFSMSFDAGFRFTNEDYDDLQLKLLAESPFYDQVEVMRTQEDWGPVAHAQIDYLGELTTARLKFAFDVQPASGKGTLTERTEFRLDLTRRLSEYFKVRGYATYFLNNRGGVDQLPPLADAEALAFHNDINFLRERLEDETEQLYGVDEKNLTLGLELNFELNRYFDLVGQYSYTRFKRELIGSDATRNRFFIRLDFKYPIF